MVFKANKIGIYTNKRFRLEKSSMACPQSHLARSSPTATSMPNWLSLCVLGRQMIQIWPCIIGTVTITHAWST